MKMNMKCHRLEIFVWQALTLCWISSSLESDFIQFEFTGVNFGVNFPYSIRLILHSLNSISSIPHCSCIYWIQNRLKPVHCAYFAMFFSIVLPLCRSDWNSKSIVLSNAFSLDSDGYGASDIHGESSSMVNSSLSWFLKAWVGVDCILSTFLLYQGGGWLVLFGDFDRNLNQKSFSQWRSGSH